MSTAVATVSVNSYPNGLDNTNRHAIIFGTIAISASPATYVTGGIPLIFPTANTDSGDVPVWVDIMSASGSGNEYSFQSAGFSPPLSPPTASGTLRIFVSETELANGASIPAGVSGDTIAYRAEFNRGI